MISGAVAQPSHSLLVLDLRVMRARKSQHGTTRTFNYSLVIYWKRVPTHNILGTKQYTIRTNPQQWSGSRQGNRGQGIHAILNPSSSSLENRERCAGWRVPNSQRGIATPCDAHVRMRGAGVQGHVKSLERSVCVCARACVHVGGKSRG